MLTRLFEAERQLPSLLELDDWQTLDILYHPPRVERVWRPWEDCRLSLHIIHPCEDNQAYLHPHPWPSAMRIIEGQYKMGRGYGKGIIAPTLKETKLFSAPDCYEMIGPDEWHYVQPIGTPAITLMVSGRPWGRDMPIEAPEQKVPLPDARKEQIIDFFKMYYG